MREPSPKRPLDGVEDGPATKKPRRPYKHHHTFRPLPQPVEPREPAFVNQETAEKLLFDAIKTVVEEEGLKRGIQDPVIESLALTAFHDAVQECNATQRFASSRLTFRRYSQILLTRATINDRRAPQRACCYRLRQRDLFSGRSAT